MKGKEITTELEITEFQENVQVRIVANSHGKVWDTLFTVRAGAGHTELKLTMEAKAYKLLPKLLIPLVMGMVQKAVAKDMDAVKVFCEE